MRRTKLKLTANKDGTMTLTNENLSAVSVERKSCRACSEPSLVPILDLGNQYLVNFVPTPDPSLPRSPLELMRCSSCGLLQLKHTADPELLYREFWYRSSVNQTMRDALKDVVRDGLRYHRDGYWLDIGANDGYLMGEVPGVFTRVSCEPARNFTDDLRRVSDEVIDDFFSARHNIVREIVGKGGFSVITSAAMFYDLDQPDQFVEDIAKSLSPRGVWINQLNDSPTMLEANAFDAICHEHLCYYDVHSLAKLYERHGLAIVSITYNEVNGGSIRVVAQLDTPDVRGESTSFHKIVTEKQALGFASRVGKWKERMLDQLHGPLVQRGPLWAYGASTKGCCLLQYLGATGAFRAIADRNPTKYGTYMTGSWLPVTHEQEMRDDKPAYAFVLPWAFKKEFVVRERELMDNGTCLVFPLPNIEVVM